MTDPASRRGASGGGTRSPSQSGTMAVDHLVGTVIGGIRLESVISKGVYGTLYLGHSVAANEPVAVKVIHAAFADMPDFLEGVDAQSQEIKALAHEHIVPIYAVRPYDPQPHIVYALHRGFSLKRVIDLKGVLPVNQALKLALAGLNALTALHSRNLYHGDITPESILIARDGSIQIAGLGIPRQTGDRTNWGKEELAEGKPQYIAPEAFDGAPLDPGSDTYAMAVVLYRCVTGGMPYDLGRPLELLKQYATRDPIVPHYANPVVPKSLSAALQAMLAKDPRTRLSESSAASRDLLAVLEGVERGQTEGPIVGAATAQMAAAAQQPPAPSEAAGPTARPGYRSVGDETGSIRHRTPRDLSATPRPGRASRRSPSLGAEVDAKLGHDSGERAAGAAAGPEDGGRREVTRRNEQVLVRIESPRDDEQPVRSRTSRLLAREHSSPPKRSFTPILVAASAAAALLLVVILLVAVLNSGGGGGTGNRNGQPVANDNRNHNENNGNGNGSGGNGSGTRNNGRVNNALPDEAAQLRRKVEDFMAVADRTVADIAAIDTTLTYEALRVYKQGLEIWDGHSHDELERITTRLGAIETFRGQLQMLAKTASHFAVQNTALRVRLLYSERDYDEAHQVLDKLADWDASLRRVENPSFVLMQAIGQELSTIRGKLVILMATQPDDLQADDVEATFDHALATFNRATNESWPVREEFDQMVLELAAVLVEVKRESWVLRINGDDRDAQAAFDELELLEKRLRNTSAHQRMRLYRFRLWSDYSPGLRQPVSVVTADERPPEQPRPMVDKGGGHYELTGPVLVQISDIFGPEEGLTGYMEMMLTAAPDARGGEAGSLWPFVPADTIREIAETGRMSRRMEFSVTITMPIDEWAPMSWFIWGDMVGGNLGGIELDRAAWWADVSGDAGATLLYVPRNTRVEIRTVFATDTRALPNPR